MAKSIEKGEIANWFVDASIGDQIDILDAMSLRFGELADLGFGMKDPKEERIYFATRILSLAMDANDRRVQGKVN